MLIQKILGKNRLQDYCFIKYKNDQETKICLALYDGHGKYLNLENNEEIYFTQIKNRELLIKYIDTEKKWLTKSQAKKLAKPYYDEFKQDISNKYLEEELVNL